MTLPPGPPRLPRFRATFVLDTPTLRDMWTLTVTDNLALTDNGWHHTEFDTIDEALVDIEERLADLSKPVVVDQHMRLDDRAMIASLSFTVTDDQKRDITFELERD